MGTLLPLNFPSASFAPMGGSHGVGDRVHAGGSSSPPRRPRPSFLPSPPKSLPQHLGEELPAPLPPYLLLLEWLSTAGLFFSTTLAEDFLFLPSPNSPSGPLRRPPPSHGWPKMENAEQRKMEAPLLCVAVDLGSFSPAGS